jgi:hypothetical protein
MIRKRNDENERIGNVQANTKGDKEPTQFVFYTMSKPDKSHNQLLSDYFKASWNSQGIGGKIQLVSSTLLLLSGDLVSRVELFFNGAHKKLVPAKAVEIEPGRIWTVEYAMRSATSNCVIVKGNDGKLLLRSPPPTTIPQVVEEVSKIGEPGVILASLAHDTFTDQWKEKFPQAIVLAGKRDAPIVSDRVKVDATVEDSEKLLKENYNIVKVLPTTFTRYDDQYLVVQLKDKKLSCLMPCGYVNMPGFSLGRYICATQGLTFVRMFSHVFASDPAQADVQTKQIISEFGTKINSYVFLHGNPLTGPTAAERLLKVQASRGKHITPFGF